MKRDFYPARRDSGHPAVELKRSVPLKAGSERLSDSFGFAVKREVAGSKKIHERE